MKRLILILFLSIFFTACKKNNSPVTNQAETGLNANTIIVSNDSMENDLIEVDSIKLIFNANSADLDKIKVGSILVSDITKVAPFGFLRKITSITISNGNEICTTEQASVTDAITNGDIKFSKTFTDKDITGQDTSGVDISALERTAKTQNLSLNFPYKKVIYDADGNSQTTNDQIYFDGEIDLVPTFDFELHIKDGNVQNLLIELTLKNINKINFESETTLASLSKEFVLTTFYLEPFTIPGPFGFPIPVAKQLIEIVIGVDGNISARVTTGAQNINTLSAGVDYENGNWNTINTLENNFTLLPLNFAGAATIEPWLQARYEFRPYGLPQSRMYVGARGSVIGEATLTSGGLNIVTKWGVQLSAKAQVEIFDKTLLDYEKIFYEKEFPLSQSTAFAYPSLTTTAISSLTQSTADCGGNITSDGGAQIIARGVCWSTSQNPTIANNKTTDGIGTGTFTSSLKGLISKTVYYVRAYATNSAGTGYGNDISFTTSGSSASDSTSGQPSKDPNCKENNTGDYCFQNNTGLVLELTLMSSPSKEHSYTPPLTATLQPGQKQCFIGVPSGPAEYEIKTPATFNGYSNDSTSNPDNSYSAQGYLYVDQCRENTFFINRGTPSYSSNDPLQTNGNLSSKDPNCNENYTGDYYFQNNTNMDLNITLVSSPSKEFSYTAPFTCTIQPGQQQCFFDVPVGPASYEIKSPATYSG
ncbi:MAG: hypothetical protein ABI091_07715, partial [Ferruginibacter sp.]